MKESLYVEQYFKLISCLQSREYDHSLSINESGRVVGCAVASDDHRTIVVNGLCEGVNNLTVQCVPELRPHVNYVKKFSLSDNTIEVTNNCNCSIFLPTRYGLFKTPPLPTCNITQIEPIVSARIFHLIPEILDVMSSRGVVYQRMFTMVNDDLEIIKVEFDCLKEHTSFSVYTIAEADNE